MLERGSGTDQPVTFNGVNELEKLLAMLVARPVDGDRALPIVGLSGDQNNVRGVLDMFNRALDGAPDRGQHRLVHALIDARTSSDPDSLPDPGATDPPQFTSLRSTLSSVCKSLSADRFGRVGALRFPRYRLAEWLMTQGPAAYDERALASGLWSSANYGKWGADLLAEAVKPVGPLERLILFVVRTGVSLIFSPMTRARLIPHIPLVGRRFRWFMRQRFMAPAHDSSRFIGFALRLTETGRAHENSDELAKLLVNAFVADLRAAYRRGWGRIGAARRTTYPVVMVHNSGTASARYLFDTISAVRNETGEDDPLLLVAGASNEPLGVDADAPRNAEHRYGTWVDELTEARQRRRENAWYLWFRLPAATEQRKPQWFVSITEPPPPRWTSRVIPLTMAAVLVIAATGAAAWHWWPNSAPNSCPVATASKWVSVIQASEGNCIGFSTYDPDDPDNAGRGYLFARREAQSARLVEAQRRVYKQNRVAEQLAAQQSTRPFITLVYLGQLTGVPGDYAAQSEDLEGLALAQYRAIKAVELKPPAPPTPDTIPLIRVVLANMGPGNTSGSQAVGMLARLVAEEPHIVGAIGLDKSRTVTLEVVNSLTKLGLPVVAPGLSADRMGKSSPLYFQISPPDQTIADMVRQYLQSDPKLAGRPIRIYHRGDDNDLYTSDTAQNMHTVGTVEFDAAWDGLQAAAREHPQVCDAVSIFAGRDTDFDNFLQTLDQACGDRPVPLIADDSANRFMASSARRKSVNSARPLLYVAKASLVTCLNGGQGVLSRVELLNLAETADPAMNANWSACADARKPLGDRTGLHPLGERVTLNYDAVELFERAVQSLVPAPSADWSQPIPVTAESVWAALRDLTATPIESTGGLLDYPTNPGSAVGRVPQHKWVGLLKVDRIWDPAATSDPTMVYGCGRIRFEGTADCRPNPLGPTS